MTIVHSDTEFAPGRFRERFRMPDAATGREGIYFCGNSLGPLPIAAAEAVEAELERWGQMAVTGHFDGPMPWVPYHTLATDGLAALTGAQSKEVVAMNALTINLHLMLTSFYRPTPQRGKVVMEQGAFPSDRHAIESQIRSHGLDPTHQLVEIAPREDRLHHEEDLEDYLARHGDEVALVLWPGVQYATGQAFDLARIARAARRAEVPVGVDLAHAIGNIELNLHDDGIDFAIWCHYKYLNAGPGSVGGAFVHARHHPFDGPRLAGWWGHEPASRFQMAPEHRPAPGAEGWQVSGPPILSTAPLVASLALFEEAGMSQLRQASLRLTGRLATGMAAAVGDEIDIITPLEPHRHGAQLSFRAKRGRKAGRLLFERLMGHGVIGDWREPDIIRMAPAPLYNTVEEVDRFVELVDELIRAQRS
mgnify:FL=1